MRAARIYVPAIMALLLAAGCYSVEKEDPSKVTVAHFGPAPVSPSVDELVMPSVPQPSNLLMVPSPQNPALMKVGLPIQVELEVLGKDEPVVAAAFSSEAATQLAESYVNTLYGFTTDGATETSFKGAALSPDGDLPVPADSIFVLELTYGAELQVTGVTRLPSAIIGADDRDPETGLWNAEAGVVPIVVGDFDPATLVTPVAVYPPSGGVWTQGATYAAVITTAITDADGMPVVSSYAFNLLKSTEPLAENGRSTCALPDATAVQLEMARAGMLNPLFSYLESAAAGDNRVAREEVALAWTFTIRPGSIALNDPTKSLFPTPNDVVMFSPASLSFDCDKDGEPDCTADHLCFPIDCENDSPAQLGFFTYMNSLDGWPASTALSASFSLPLETESVTTDSISLYKFGETGAQAQPVSVSLNQAGTGVTIVPQGGLQAGGKYGAVITTGLLTSGGVYEVRPSTITAVSKLTEPVVTQSDTGAVSLLPDFGVSAGEALLLEGIRQGIDMLIKAVGLDDSRANIAAVWGFTVQSHNEALFDPTSATVPYPNDVLMALDETGTPTHVNVPVDPTLPPSLQDVMIEMNKLDGFSPMAATHTRFLRPLDTGSFRWLKSMTELLGGNGLGDEISIGMADITEVDPTLGEVGMMALMQSENIYTDGEVKATFENGALTVRPEPGQPLKAGRRYMLIAFDNLKSKDLDPDGQPYPIEVAPVFFMARNPHPLFDKETGKTNLLSLSDGDAQELEMLRSQYDVIFGALESALVGVPRERILMFWTFTTQTIGTWLQGIDQDLMTMSVGDEPSGTLQEAEATSVNLDFADQVMLNGKFTAYTALENTDLTAVPPVAGRMQFDEAGNAIWAQYSLPYILLLPKQGQPETPAPVVILQHGLGGTKDLVLSQADAFLKEGYAVVAIDLVLHGQRTAEGGNNGDGFFSADAVATRDHLVQSALDIAQLAKFVSDPSGLNGWLTKETGDVNKINPDEIYFVGNSLGAMAGTLALAITDELRTAALVVPGGHLTRILTETENEDFRKPIEDSLKAMGFEPGTPEYNQFLDTAQMLLDRGDPLHYARHLVKSPLNSTAGNPMAQKKLFILIAGKDGFIPKATTMELACAARDGVQPYTKEYSDMCHGFFFHKCGGGDGLDPGAVEAAEDIITFLAADGSAENVFGAEDADSIVCDSL